MNIGQKLKNKRQKADDNGWEDWGGYFNAKKSKLQDQYKETAATEVTKVSDIFAGVSILVNGLTNPNSEELKCLMAAHGGVYQVYQNSATTHIIASNLPNVKINKLGSVPIVKPSWIVDSIALNKLLDYRRYLLYTNQSTSQPKLDFPVVDKPKSDSPPQKTKTASDPHFLEEFYSNSRLHLIATLGAEFKQLISDLRDQPQRDFPSREKLLSIQCSPGSAPHSTVIMHIDMDCFFVSVGLRNRPELRGLPVAVTHARNPQINPSKERQAAVTFNMDRLPQGAEARLVDGRSSMSEVASCSYEARRCGVKNGMFLGAAAKLCPNIKTIPYDFEETAKFLGHGLCDCLSKSSTTSHAIPDVKTIHREVKNLYEKMNVDFVELRGMGIQLSKLEKVGHVNPTLNKFLQQPSKKSEIPLKVEVMDKCDKPARGRPKKGAKPPPKHAISNFFKSKKETTSQTKVQIRKEDVCLDTLKELPKEIRDEVIREYNLDPVIPKPTRPAQPKKVLPPAKKSPFSGLQWPQLKPILYEWMKSGPTPDDYDVTLLGEHFRQLAMASDIDWLRIALNFLHRNFSDRGCPWHQAYHKIVDLTQRGMVKTFGGELLVKENFQCCFKV